jgi:hypothetical protein
MRAIRNLICCALVSCLFCSCAWSVGGRHGDLTTQPTKGQELMDLKRAKDTGAINDEEYATQKKKILDK